MRKILISISVILFAILLIYILLYNSSLNKTKVYRFETSVISKFNNKGDVYKSYTKEFVAKANKMHLEKNIIIATKYNVDIKLNSIELIRIRLSHEMNNYYNSYREYVKPLGSIENQ